MSSSSSKKEKTSDFKSSGNCYLSLALRSINTCFRSVRRLFPKNKLLNKAINKGAHILWNGCPKFPSLTAALSLCCEHKNLTSGLNALFT